MTPPDAHARALQSGLSYADYLAAWRAKLTAPTQALDADARRYVFYARYNFERSERVHAAFVPSPRLTAALALLSAPQLWLVITEDWCGDSAYALPVIADAAARTPLVTLRILPRDAHLDVMDGYLTNGGRSIPKLIGFGADGRELFQWGPRTADAVRHRETLVAEGLEKTAVIARLTDWYDADGWTSFDAELAGLVEGSVAAL